VTRYVCSWCGRKQEGVNLSTCDSCPGPLEYVNRLGDQQQAAREKLRKALQHQPTPPPYKGRWERRLAAPNPPKPKPLPPPQPRKPKPLTLKESHERRQA